MSDHDRIFPYNIKQATDENKGRYKLGDYYLIQCQILQTNIMRAIWQTVRKIITNEILGIKGLKCIISVCFCLVGVIIHTGRVKYV